MKMVMALDGGYLGTDFSKKCSYLNGLANQLSMEKLALIPNLVMRYSTDA